NPLRFQGQYFDTETGLHYNRHRYYNPGTGRFLTPDPIKLAGGLNNYRYVPNPTGWVDPLGLDTCPGDKESNALSTQNTATKSAVDEGTPDVPSYETPYKPLSGPQKEALLEKVESRTATQDEVAHLDWDRRFSLRRRQGVRGFWSDERARLKRGEPGTRNWSETQKEDILNKKTPKFNDKSIEGHHMYNALDYPQLANDRLNIYPATRSEHQYRWHGGNFQNDTMGKPLNPLVPEEF
ncbi:RHS repeat-associated core domain-containing protein, partial [Pseudomonas capsici]|uniref:RHS repeat-associated core domain-containing protein n=1 Tax=Pseudomonas capsici TaxID=2810614 RepID=UPI00403B0B53